MVRAIMIVEMAGRPTGHLIESLKKHIGVLNTIPDIEVHSIKLSEPKEILGKDGGGNIPELAMFSAFAEADFETEKFSRLTETMFDFMPSSVEIVKPSKVTLNMIEATDLLNNISGRMHRYDEFAKIAGAKMQQMNAQLQEAQKILTAKDTEIAKLKKGKNKSPAKKTTKTKSAKKKK